MTMRYNRSGILQIVMDRARVNSTAVKPGEGVDDGEWIVPDFFTREDLQMDRLTGKEIWAVYNTYGETAFLKESITSVIDVVDHVLILHGGNWWGKKGVDGTVELVKSITDPDEKIILRDCGHFSGSRAEGQLAQRSYGLSLVPAGHWHWLIDADEVYDLADSSMVADFLRSDASSESEVWSLETIAYYQSVNLVGWTEKFARLFRSRKGRRFSGVMQVSDGDRVLRGKHLPGPVIHHFSYVRSDDEIRAKLDDYERRYKSGVFRKVTAEQCWKTWLEVRGSEDKTDSYVHPIPDYTNQRSRRSQLECGSVKTSRWWLGPDRDVSIVVVTHNSNSMLRGMLESFRITAMKDVGLVEWIIVDNASKDTFTLRAILDDALDGHALILNGKNLMFTKAVNQGLAAAKHRNVLLLNPDLRFKNGKWLSSMLDTINGYPNVGVVGCRMVDDKGILHHAGGYVKGEQFLHVGRGERDVGQYVVEKDVEWVTGAVFMIRRECFMALGGLDETYPHYHSDNKFCLKARKNGFRVIYNPSTVVHYVGKSCTEK